MIKKKYKKHISFTSTPCALCQIVWLVGKTQIMQMLQIAYASLYNHANWHVIRSVDVIHLSFDTSWYSVNTALAKIYW